jgi:hypothetical protein
MTRCIRRLSDFPAIAGSVMMLIGAACGRSSVSPSEASLLGSQSAVLSVDSTSYHATTNAMGFYVTRIRATFVNTGAAPVYLRRACDTGSVPSSTLQRPAGDPALARLNADDICLLGGIPSPPAPIEVPAGGSHSWTINAMSSGTSTQIPVANATGTFQLSVTALKSSKPGSAFANSDLLDTSMRTTSTFVVVPP